MGRRDSIEIGGGLFAVIAAFIFLAAAVGHGLRAFYGWDLIVGDWHVPIWTSWLVALVAFLMSITAVRRL